MTGVPLMAMQGMTKRFPGVLALDDVDFAVRAGEVLAATGNMVITMAAPDSPRAVPWSPEARLALTGGAPSTPPDQAEAPAGPF